MVLCCSSVAGLKSFQTSERRLLSKQKQKRNKKAIMLIEHAHEHSMELARDIFEFLNVQAGPVGPLT